MPEGGALPLGNRLFSQSEGRVLGTCLPCEFPRGPPESRSPRVCSSFRAPPCHYHHLSSVCILKRRAKFRLWSQEAFARHSPMGTRSEAGASACSGVGLAPSTRAVRRGSGHCRSEWTPAPLLYLLPGMTTSTELCTSVPQLSPHLTQCLFRAPGLLFLCTHTCVVWSTLLCVYSCTILG